MDRFTSQIFGETRKPSEEELAAVKKLVEEVPVCVFQELNKKLNAIGFLIVIDTKDTH